MLPLTYNPLKTKKYKLEGCFYVYYSRPHEYVHLLLGLGWQKQCWGLLNCIFIRIWISVNVRLKIIFDSFWVYLTALYQLILYTYRMTNCTMSTKRELGRIMLTEFPGSTKTKASFGWICRLEEDNVCLKQIQGSVTHSTCHLYSDFILWIKKL
jgi:hypothetical protein